MTKILNFKNNQIESMVDMLSNLSISGKASRGRSKLKEKLIAKLKEYNDEVEEARDPYFVKDKDGERIVKDKKYVYKDNVDKKELGKTLAEIGEEQASVEFTEYSEKFKALYESLDNYGLNLSGKDADCYDLLMDQLEDNYAKGDVEVEHTGADGEA